jgi:radical SAM protein with 4Fe4S-binding SPASM domain
MAYSVVIAKPTKDCNADCAYCSAPPDGNGRWSFDDFTVIFDRLLPKFTGQVDWIWHGGEPMLMGPDYFKRCAEYANARHSGIRFAIQTNLLAYNSKRWKDVFEEVFGGRISTSYDPYQKYRTVKGSASTYDRLFWRALDHSIEDGFRPLVIGVYDEGSISAAFDIYDKALSYGVDGFDIRYNYAYPAGRANDSGMLIAPESYGQMLIDLYDRWIVDVPVFRITPLDQMLEKVAGYRNMQCPWTRHCGGRFITVDPNGDAYNCSEFSDLGDTRYRFGNLLTGQVQVNTAQDMVFYPPQVLAEAISSSPASREIMSRQILLPPDCKTCRHFDECEGGCARDAVLFERGMAGKFGYCRSWKMVFDRLKASVLSGEADRILCKLGSPPEDAKSRLSAYGVA